MNADMEIRANLPRYDVALSSQADDAIAALLGLPDAQNVELEIGWRMRMLTAAANLWALGLIPDAPTPLSRDGGGQEHVESPVNVQEFAQSEIAIVEVGNSVVNSNAAPVEIAQNEEVTASPKAGEVGGQSSEYPRFHPMKGFSKAWRKVWRWLDDHAAEIDHEFPTHRTIGDANDVSHVTAGKIVKKWREHNDITPPANYYQEAS